MSETRVSQRMARLSPSMTFAMNAMSNELKAKGIDVVNMSLGEPDFNTPDHVKAAACQALDENYTHYTPVPGSVSLKNAIIGKLQRENGLTYGPAEILVSNGAKQSLCNAVMALIDEGDEVIIPAPYWVSYPQMVLLAGGKPVHVDTGIDQDYKMTPDQLEKAITPRTRMLILCSPSNPSGAVYSKEELEALSAVILRHEGLLVLSDEIYEHLNYVGAHASIASCPGMWERTIVVNGVSKAYAMTGWRIGFLAAPKWIVSACNMLQGQYTSGPCSVSQKAAEAAWNGPQDCVEEMRQAFKRRRTCWWVCSARSRAWKWPSPKEPSICSRNAPPSSERRTAPGSSTPPPTWRCTCWKSDTWPPWAATPSALRTTSGCPMPPRRRISWKARSGWRRRWPF